MKKWGLIVDGRVAEITEVDPEGRFSPELKWVALAAGADIGDLYKDGRFSRPAPRVPTREEVLAQRQARYKAESDPLFMEWQYDQTDAKRDAWISSVDRIKDELPLPAA